MYGLRQQKNHSSRPFIWQPIINMDMSYQSEKDKQSSSSEKREKIKLVCLDKSN